MTRYKKIFEELINRISDRLGRTIENPSRYYTVGISVLVNVLLFGLYFLFMSPAFETNDDVRMMLNVSGAIDGHPSEYLLHTNVLIGIILKFFFTHISGINWYPVYLFAAHFISMVVILYTLLRLNFNWSGICRFVFLFIFFEYPFLMFLQFTSTAFVVAISGVCLLTASFRMKDMEGWFYVVFAALLLVTAGLIRQQVFFGVGVLAGPFLLLKFWKTGRSKILLFLCLSLSIVFSSILFNTYYYSMDTQWKEYFAFNAARGQLNAYPKLVYNEQTRHAYTQVGWSKNDFLMFKNKFFYDRNVYSTEKLTSINRALRNERILDEMIKILIHSIEMNRIILCAGALFLVLSILSIRRDERKFMYWTIATAFGICIVLSYSARLPFRVFIPIVFFVNVVVTVLLSYSPAPSVREMQPRKKITGTAAIVLLVFLLLPVHLFILHRWGDANRTNGSVLTKKLQYLSLWKDTLFIVCGGNSLDIQNTSPYSDLQEYRNLNVLFSGWSIHSPYSEKMMAKYGVDDRTLHLGGGDNILFIMGNDTPYQNMMRTFVMEHYRQTIHFTAFGSYDDMYMFKILKSEIRNE